MASDSKRNKTKASKAKATKKRVQAGRPGRPRIKKAEGVAPVRAYIAALSGWKKDVAKRFDALVESKVPNVKRAVKWSSPMYGIEGKGWFASFGAFSKHVKIIFFEGALLKPPVPTGTSAKMRGLDLREGDEFPEAKIASWVRQAAALPGWGKA